MVQGFDANVHGGDAVLVAFRTARMHMCRETPNAIDEPLLQEVRLSQARRVSQGAGWVYEQILERQ